jgi:hypothetical protein
MRKHSDPQHRFPTVVITGKIKPNELRETVPLHPSYRAMAEATGVPPDDAMVDQNMRATI